MKVFLDHASTTPVLKEAIDSLLIAMAEVGNPSSVHTHGQSARAHLEDARDDLARALGCNRSEVIFNSGGTESNNQAIKGIFWARNKDRSRKVVISAPTEHHALLDPIHWLCEHENAQLKLVEVKANGELDLDSLERLVAEHGDDVALISLMWVNNETGVITDIHRVCDIAGQIPVHTDAVAAVGKVPISFSSSGLTAMSVSGHKFGAPIGIGALLVSRSFKPESLLHGGGQERGLRSGTMNYPMAKALAVAALSAVANQQANQAKFSRLRDHFEAELVKRIPDLVITASGANRVSSTSNVILPGTKSDSMLFLLDQQGLSVSAGSACQAGVLGPSHVLLGMGYSEDLASACLRISFGHDSDLDAVDFAVKAIDSAHVSALKANALSA